jgi:agmatine/peptidylarginine deiminase
LVLDTWISACTPGEFETQAALVLGLNELAPKCPHMMVEVIDALIDRIPLLGIVGGEEQRQEILTFLCDWGLPSHLMRFVFMPVMGMWVRDYGPGFARRSDGTVTILDAEYGQSERRNDDKVPSALAALLRVPVVRIPLIADGGLILSNGEGLCLTTGKLFSRNAGLGNDENRIQQIFRDYYGFHTGVAFFSLEREETGHADMFATFTGADCLVLGSYDAAVDAGNAAILEKNAEMLKSMETRRGRLKVVRMPMPSNKDGVFRTYTNVIYANGVLLVPSYPDQDQKLERDALDIYAGLLPGWEIIPIDCTEVIKARGALRCMSINIPWLTDRFPPPVPRKRAHCGLGDTTPGWR